MPTVARHTTQETEIRVLIDQWVAALRAKDIEGMLAFYAPDIRLFDLHSCTQYRGIAPYRHLWESCMPHFEGPLEYDFHQLEVTAGDDVAFYSGLAHMRVSLESGPHESWLRATGCFQKIDGQWRIVHEHVSVPIDMANHQGMMNLPPN